VRYHTFIINPYLSVKAMHNRPVSVCGQDRE